MGVKQPEAFLWLGARGRRRYWGGVDCLMRNEHGIGLARFARSTAPFAQFQASLLSLLRPRTERWTGMATPAPARQQPQQQQGGQDEGFGSKIMKLVQQVVLIYLISCVRLPRSLSATPRTIRLNYQSLPILGLLGPSSRTISEARRKRTFQSPWRAMLLPQLRLVRTASTRSPNLPKRSHPYGRSARRSTCTSRSPPRRTLRWETLLGCSRGTLSPCRNSCGGILRLGTGRTSGWRTSSSTSRR